MSDHRRARHIWRVAVCVAVMIASTGCRQSPFHRRDDDRPAGPDGKPFGYQPPQSALDQASIEKKPPPVATAIATAAAAAPGAAPIVVASSVANPGPPPPAPIETAPAAPAETPMLDAALKRVEAIETEQRRLLREESEPRPEVQLATYSVASPVQPPGPPHEPKRDQAVERASAEAPPVDAAKLLNAAAELIDRLPADLSAAALPAGLPRTVAMLAPTPSPAAEPESKTETEIVPEPSPQPESFAVNEARVCRSIQGFGSFEPMDPRSLRVGRPVLVYCEPVGLRHEPRGDEYVSRVVTRVELIAEDGASVWRVDGEAEDHCRKPRRDSFVGAQINLPAALSPGAYTIRLTQTDALAQQSATAEIPVTIGP